MIIAHSLCAISFHLWDGVWEGGGMKRRVGGIGVGMGFRKLLYKFVFFRKLLYKFCFFQMLIQICVFTEGEKKWVVEDLNFRIQGKPQYPVARLDERPMVVGCRGIAPRSFPEMGKILQEHLF